MWWVREVLVRDAKEFTSQERPSTNKGWGVADKYSSILVIETDLRNVLHGFSEDLRGTESTEITTP